MTSLIRQPVSTIAYASVGLLLRVIVTNIYKETLRQRVEVTTPINDWKRAHEAIYLWNSGLDPYSGNLFHEYPISLQFYKIISSYFNVDLAFASTDIITALLLRRSPAGQEAKGQLVFLTYLFSPLTIVACAGQSTSIFTNFLISVVCMTLQIEQFRALTCVLCAFLACNNIHYATLVLPIFLCIEYCSSIRSQKGNNNNGNSNSNSSNNNKPAYHSNENFYQSLTTSAGICLLSVITIMLTSYLLMGNSWSFLKSTYLFVLKVQDLTPNIGLSWYLFTEMFEHFLDFFTWIVQINAFIHVVPISVFLRDKPFFALHITILMSTIFQPYPNLAHIGLATSLLAQYNDLFPYMKQGLKVTCTAVACMCLLPVFWHLWIMMGTANSNFYFGATLAFSTAFILLMVDLLNANGFLQAKQRFDEKVKSS